MIRWACQTAASAGPREKAFLAQFEGVGRVARGVVSGIDGRGGSIGGVGTGTLHRPSRQAPSLPSARAKRVWGGVGGGGASTNSAARGAQSRSQPASVRRAVKQLLQHVVHRLAVLGRRRAGVALRGRRRRCRGLRLRRGRIPERLAAGWRRHRWPSPCWIRLPSVSPSLPPSGLDWRVAARIGGCRHSAGCRPNRPSARRVRRRWRRTGPCPSP